jgi:curli production assembly/transport component CsgE
MFFAAPILFAAFISLPSVNQKDTLKVQPAPASLKKMIEEVVSNKVKPQEYLIEIDGLLVDDSKTRAGKEFYDLFYNGFVAPQNARNYTITVSEKPFRLNTTQIVVMINDNPVYQNILQPRQEIIETMCEEAIATTQEYLTYYEDIMKQLNGEDMTGSGIY